MGIVKSNLAISLDGFSSAPGQSREEPFGVGGGRLTEWMFETDLPGREGDAMIRGTWSDGVGAFVMGRHMFGGYAGEWDLSWRGLVGRGPALPRAGVRADPPRAGAAADGRAARRSTSSPTASSRR